MRGSVLVLVVVLVPVRAIAQDAPRPSPAPTSNEITLGLTGMAGDLDSPEFLEYRDVPQGVTLPSFRFAGHAGGFDYDLSGHDAAQDDQRYRARLARGSFDLTAHLDDLPHRLGDGRIAFGDGEPGVFALPFHLRRDIEAAVDQRAASSGLDYGFLSSLADDVLTGGRPVSLGLVRRTSGVGLNLEPASGLSVRARYDAQRRSGTRSSGVGFGLMNAVEIAEPVEDATDDATLAAELERRWGVVRASAGYSAYRNAIGLLAVDNPLRGTDATAPGAQLGPNDRTTAGAAFAEVAVPPDNEALTAAAGGVLRLPLRTRFSADLTAARWRQKDAVFPGFTTNSAIVTPSPAPAVHSLDAEIRTSSQTLQLTSAPWSRLALRARFRRYDMDNRTERVTLSGQARLDAVAELAPRITVPYSNARRRMEASIGYGLGSWRVEAGHRQDDVTRTFRETEDTTEKTWTGALSGAMPLDGHLSLTYEHGHRGFEAYDSRLSPGASRVNVHPVRSLGAGRRYDQADRERDAVGARLEIAPVEALVLAASYTLEARTYPLSAYGLVNTRAHAGSADASLAPGGRWSAHAFYAYELESSFQRVRHSPGPTISIDLRDIWDATLSDRVHSLGAGLETTLGAGTTARLDAVYQRADGLGDFGSAPGGDPDLAEDIPDFDDVRWITLSAEVEHRVGGGWSVSAGAWWEGQEVADTIDEGRPDYVPGAFVLVPKSLDYGTIVVTARITRRW